MGRLRLARAARRFSDADFLHRRAAQHMVQDLEFILRDFDVAVDVSAHPGLFEAVARGDVPQGIGIAVGRVLDDPVLQRQDVAEARRKRLSEAEATEVASQVLDAGAEDVSQETLFGTETRRQPLFAGRAQLAATAIKRIGADARFFGYITRGTRPEELARVGGTIDVEAAKGIAEESNQATEVFKRLSTTDRYALFDLLGSIGYDVFRYAEGSEPQGAALTRAGMTAERHFDVLAVPKKRAARAAA